MRRHGKYNARRTNGYASAAEARFARELALMATAGEVLDVMEQPRVNLVAGIVLVPDFRFRDVRHCQIHRRPKSQCHCYNPALVYVDVKGVETPVFKLKKQLWREFGPGLLRIVKASGKGFVVAEEIEGGQHK